MAAERREEIFEKVDQETLADINRYMLEADMILEDGGQRLFGQRLHNPFLAIEDRLQRALTLTNVLDDPMSNRYRGKVYERMGDITQKAPLMNAFTQARDEYRLAKDFYGLVADAESITRVKIKLKSLRGRSIQK